MSESAPSTLAKLNLNLQRTDISDDFRTQTQVILAKYPNKDAPNGNMVELDHATIRLHQWIYSIIAKTEIIKSNPMRRHGQFTVERPK